MLFINYKNENNFKVNTFRNEITELILQFTDQNGYNINFNGVQWSIVLQLNIINEQINYVEERINFLNRKTNPQGMANLESRI